MHRSEDYPCDLIGRVRQKYLKPDRNDLQRYIFDMLAGAVENASYGKGSMKDEQNLERV